MVSAQVVKGVPFCIRFPCSLHRYRRLLRQVFFIIPKIILTLVRRYRSYVGYFRVYQGLSEWIWNPYYGSLFRSLPVLFTDIFSFGKSEKTSGAILLSKKTFSSLLSQYWRPAISLYKGQLIGFPSSNDIVTNGPFAKRMRNEFELKEVLLCRIFVIAHRSAQKSGARSEEVSIEQILILKLNLNFKE